MQQYDLVYPKTMFQNGYLAKLKKQYRDSTKRTRRCQMFHKFWQMLPNLDDAVATGSEEPRSRRRPATWTISGGSSEGLGSDPSDEKAVVR